MAAGSFYNHSYSDFCLSPPSNMPSWWPRYHWLATHNCVFLMKMLGQESFCPHLFKNPALVLLQLAATPKIVFSFLFFGLHCLFLFLLKFGVLHCGVPSLPWHKSSWWAQRLRFCCSRQTTETQTPDLSRDLMGRSSWLPLCLQTD